MGLGVACEAACLTISEAAHAAGPGPTEQHRKRVSPSSKCTGAVPCGARPRVWDQPRAGRSLVEVAPGRDEKEPGGHGLGEASHRGQVGPGPSTDGVGPRNLVLAEDRPPPVGAKTAVHLVSDSSTWKRLCWAGDLIWRSCLWATVSESDRSCLLGQRCLQGS